MNGKEFKQIVNKIIKDDDSVALMGNRYKENCIYAMKKDYIRRKDDGEHDMIAFSVEDFD